MEHAQEQHAVERALIPPALARVTRQDPRAASVTASGAARVRRVRFDADVFGVFGQEFEDVRRSAPDIEHARGFREPHVPLDERAAECARADEILEPSVRRGRGERVH